MGDLSIHTVRPAAGSVIGGKYLLVEAIAEGGMGTLYRAVQLGLDREVALKLVDVEEPGFDERVARTLREAEICAAIRHRNVVAIHDVDRTPEGRPFLVMELLRGETLAQRTARAPSMRLDELVGILADCLLGLHAVHESGVVHRDLKPENIVLADCGDEGVVPKLLDFGISYRGLRAGRGERRLTHQGTVLGTPWYMSPEQARAADAVGPEADLYSMGVVAYEALTGRLPFDSDSLFGLLLKVTTEDAPTVAERRPDLPVALSEVVAKAMSRAPEDRFDSALAMRDALLGAVRGTDPAFAAIVPSDAWMVLPDDPTNPGASRGANVVVDRNATTIDLPRARPRHAVRAAISVVSAMALSFGVLATRRGEADGDVPSMPPSALEAAASPDDDGAPGEALPDDEKGTPSIEGEKPAARGRATPTFTARRSPRARGRSAEAPLAFRRLDF